MTIRFDTFDEFGQYLSGALGKSRAEIDVLQTQIEGRKKHLSDQHFADTVDYEPFSVASFVGQKPGDMIVIHSHGGSAKDAASRVRVLHLF